MSKRWTKEEENLVLSSLKQHKSIANLPLTILSEKIGKTPDSIRRKAIRLQESSTSLYKWVQDEQKEAFLLYLQGMPLAEILVELHEQGSTASLADLEDELKRLREVWSRLIRRYAEERQLATAKHFSLDTIEFYINSKDTTSDMIRKALHRKIKNG